MNELTIFHWSNTFLSEITIQKQPLYNQLFFNLLGDYRSKASFFTIEPWPIPKRDILHECEAFEAYSSFYLAPIHLHEKVIAFCIDTFGEDLSENGELKNCWDKLHKLNTKKQIEFATLKSLIRDTIKRIKRFKEIQSVPRFGYELINFSDHPIKVVNSHRLTASKLKGWAKKVGKDVLNDTQVSFDLLSLEQKEKIEQKTYYGFCDYFYN